MDMMLQDPVGMAEQADTVKDAVLLALHNDGLLTLEQAAEWSKTHCIVFKRRHRISTWYRRLFKDDAENLYSMILAKIPEQKED
jgi:hypothetical protein